MSVIDRTGPDLAPDLPKVGDQMPPERGDEPSRVVPRPATESRTPTLKDRVAASVERVHWQASPALMEALSDEELDEERKLAEKIRRRDRGERWRNKRAEIRRARKSARDARRREDAAAKDTRWHQIARHRRARLTSPDARLAGLAWKAALTHRGLMVLVVIGMAWSAINVQQGLVPPVRNEAGQLVSDLGNPLFWVSYGVEVMISGCLVFIMLASSTFSEWGRPLRRGVATVIEIGLLLFSAALNVGPRLNEDGAELSTVWQYLVAPVMVGAVLWLHAWTSARYGELLADVVIEDEVDGGRLDDDQALVLDQVRRAFEAMSRGELQPSTAPDGGGVPAVRPLQNYLNITQGQARHVRDVMKRLNGTSDQ
jgi:hypothetical protein